MKDRDFYTDAHLIVAAARVLEHRDSAPPTLDAVCQFLSFSLEQVGHICRKLKEIGIIDMVESAYGNRLYIKNHLKIEDIPRGAKESRLDDELKKFQSTQKKLSQKVESIKAEQEEKKKNLFAKLEKEMKKGLEKKKI
ncbi:MAG: hypothetical protein JRI75_07075 [Deltaproteobacteria bacterium]|nr:hypothetical protein [Deltaproteobacteria bacterium]